MAKEERAKALMDAADYVQKLAAPQTRVFATTARSLAGTKIQPGPVNGDEELIWNVATLHDVLARIRQLESIVSALLLAGGIRAPQPKVVEEVKKEDDGIDAQGSS